MSDLKDNWAEYLLNLYFQGHFVYYFLEKFKVEK